MDILPKCSRCGDTIERLDDVEECPYCFRDLCFDCLKKYGCCEKCQLKHEKENKG